MSIAEVAIKNFRTERVYDYSNYNWYDHYNLTIRCLPYIFCGVGIWCSVLVSLIFKVVNYFNNKLINLK